MQGESSRSAGSVEAMKITSRCRISFTFFGPGL